MKPSAEYIKLCGVADEDTGKYKKSFIGKGELLFMADKIIENNQVTIIGEVASPFVFSHEVFGEGFYMADILVKRLSDCSDCIPVMISERLIDVSKDYRGEYVQINGQFRSYNRHEEKRNRLYLQEKSALWKKRPIKQRQIRFFWMAIYAKHRFTGKHLLEERLQIC